MSRALSLVANFASQLSMPVMPMQTASISAAGASASNTLFMVAPECFRADCHKPRPLGRVIVDTPMSVD